MEMKPEEHFSEARKLLAGYQAVDVGPQDVAGILGFAMALLLHTHSNDGVGPAMKIGGTAACIASCYEQIGVSERAAGD